MDKRKLKILVVEDDKINQLLITHMLSKKGHAISIAENGQEAVDFIKIVDFDIILMDLMMPVMNGFEATRQIRMINNSHVPIVAVTSNCLNEEEQKCNDVGMNGFITKPVSIRHLKNAFSQVGLEL